MFASLAVGVGTVLKLENAQNVEKEKFDRFTRRAKLMEI